MGAAYNSQERSPALQCLPGTRKEVLEKISAWANGAQGRPICWLFGPAGAGKSAIAQTVAETYAGRNQLAASFFFGRTAAHRNEVKNLFPTIAVQITLSAPEKRQRLDEILNNDPFVTERALGSVDLLASLLEGYSASLSCTPSPFLVVVDALDECQRNDDQCWILAQVARMVHIHHPPLRFLIVSRPEAHICEAFEERDLVNITKVVSLYGDYQASSDISMYLRSEFSRIYDSKRYRDVMEFVPRPWPSEDIIERLVRKSGGCFSYVATVIKFIDEEYASPAARLDQVLGILDSSVLVEELIPFAELDQLHIQILSSYPASQLPMLKHILGYVVMPSVQQCMDSASIEHILDLPPGQMRLTLRGLRSLVSFKGLFETPVLIQASFGDFLLDKARAKHYHIDFEEWIYTTFCYAFSQACRLLDPHHCASLRLEGQFLSPFRLIS